MKTIIRPISEVSRKITEIESITIEQNTPVHLTKNGSNHLVIMSNSYYENLIAQMNLYENLLRSEIDLRRGKTLPLDIALSEIDQHLKERLNEQPENQRISG